MNKRPNIIVICTDQQRTDTLSCYGSDFLNTPGFDKIAELGIRFDRAYCTSAVCTPSRVSLFSGQYVSRHDVWSIGVNTGDDVTMMQHTLADSGYKTGLIGKAHLESYQATPEQSQESLNGFEKGYGDWLGPYYGFDHVRLALGHVNYGMTGHYGAWLRQTFSEEQVETFKHLKPVGKQSFGGEAYRSELPLAYHNSVWTTSSAIEFLDTVDDDDPFFLFISYQDPHHPHAIPLDCSPSVTCDQVPSPNFDEHELDDKPPHFKLAREGKLPGSRFPGTDYPMSGQGDGSDFRLVDKASAAEGRAYYYSMIGIIDEQLQRLWAKMEAREIFDDTLIIVTSDHGELLGDHGLWMKGPFHYEEIVRIPLLIKPPKAMDTIETNAQSTVSLVDLVPTCLGVAGICADNLVLDGQNILSDKLKPDRPVFVETIQDWHSLVCNTVVDTNWKLTWYADEDFGELYNFVSDPDEKQNLWSDRYHQEIKVSLISKILTMKIDTGQPHKSRIAYA